MINRGGEKILPLEVDITLAAHPSVAEAVTFGIPHPTLGEDVAAAVVLRPGRSVGESELRQFASGRLAPFKVPRRILFLETIPRGATGKPLRGLLTEQYAPAAAAPLPPADALERRLAAIWAEMLNLARSVSPMTSSLSVGTHTGRPYAAARRTRMRLPCVRSVRARHHRAVGWPHPEPTYGALAAMPLFCVPAPDRTPTASTKSPRHLGRRTPVCVCEAEPLAERGIYTVEHVADVLLSSLRATCPQGPYLLAGHCFGGIVAFEMARRLIEGGEQVALLAMIDTPRPGYPVFFRDWRIDLRALLHLDWIRRSDYPLREALAGARGLWRCICNRPSRPVAQVQSRDADHANRLAARHYVPGSYAGRIVSFGRRPVDDGVIARLPPGLAGTRGGWLRSPLALPAGTTPCWSNLSYGVLGCNWRRC